MYRISLQNTVYLRRRRAATEARQALGSARFCLVNYASGAVFEEGQRRQNASAASMGEFDFIRTWSRSRIEQTTFYQENSSILDHSRGNGYWLWKPFIINDALSFLDDGDFLFYCDTGPQATQSFEYSIYPLCKWIAEDTSRVGAACLKAYENRIWTKRDCFYYMDCDSPAFWHAEHIQASYVVFQINSRTRGFIAEWLNFSRDNRIISDDSNTSGLENLPGFIDHRHDQSIFTNLIKKNNFKCSIVDAGNPLSKNINVSLKNAIDKITINTIGKLIENYSASQSSFSAWSTGPNESASAINDEFVGHYAFHTDREPNPWWMVEFEASSLLEIHIRNRLDGARQRAATLRVEIRISSEQWVEVYDAYASEWNCFDPIILEVSGLIATGVRLSLRENEFFHLNSVGIYV